MSQLREMSPVLEACLHTLMVNLDDAITRWAKDIFAGKTEYDAQEEAALLGYLDDVNEIVRDRGTQFLLSVRCNVALHRLVFLRRNWVSPRRSTSPAPKARFTPEKEEEIKRNLAKLKPFPGGTA